jgi:TRAP-type C4-dicarboxylate transport system permease small subunit
MDQQNLPPVIDANVLPSSTLAIVSLVSAILGFTFVPIIGTIVALITGYMARSETRSIPPRASGDGMATAGIIMGWVQVALLVIGVCCTIAYFVFFLGIFAASSQ